MNRYEIGKLLEVFEHLCERIMTVPQNEIQTYLSGVMSVSACNCDLYRNSRYRTSDLS